MLQLLREDEVAAAFRKARKRATHAVVAVPFWGNGAVAALGISDSESIRVLCNLDHPGCNPDVIAELRDLGIKVRTHPRLHAKVYATAEMAIVGSSNASTNGLTVEGSASRGWIEANIASDDPALVAKVLALFEDVWADPVTRTVRKADIEAARRERAARPPTSFIALGRKTLLAACRERPDEFRSVYVAAYSEPLSRNATRLLSDLKKGVRSPQPGVSVSDFRKAWGYQFQDVPEGAWLIDLSCLRPDRPRFAGCLRATGVRLMVDGETDLSIALRGAVKHFGVVLPLSATEKASLVKSAHLILARSGGKLVSLPDAVKLIDRAK